LKKLTTGTTENNEFSVSIVVYSNCHISQFLHQMFNMFALLLDDAPEPATPLNNGASTVCLTLIVTQFFINK